MTEWTGSRCIALPRIQPGLFLMFCLALSPCTLSAQTSETEEVLEIEVRGYRRLSVLLNAIDEAEDHMYAVFNDLNDDDRYDIHCLREAPLGTRIRQKVCKPEFLESAERETALDFVSAAQGSAYANTATPTNAVIGFEMPNLEEKMREIALSRPEFAEALTRLYLLQEQYRNRVSSSSGSR